MTERRWLDGYVAFVTGGASGIGAAVVDAYIQEGARVGILDRNGDGMRELSARHGPAVLGIEGDVASPEDNVTAVTQIVERFGRLDVFVGNAGIGDRNTPLVDIPIERLSQAFQELFDINVKGLLLGVRASMDDLLRSKGSVILTGSYSSFHAGGGGALYVASKHAVAGLVRQLAYEFAPHLRVNGVAPGVADTKMLGIEALDHTGVKRAVIDGVEKHIPLGVVPDTMDHAWPYVLLASRERARAITGSIYETDSGFAIRGLTQAAGQTLA